MANEKHNMTEEHSMDEDHAIDENDSSDEGNMDENHSIDENENSDEGKMDEDHAIDDYESFHDDNMEDDNLDDDNSDDESFGDNLVSAHDTIRRRLAELEAQDRNEVSNEGDEHPGEELDSAGDVVQRDWAFMQAQYLDADWETYIGDEDSPAREDTEYSVPPAIKTIMESMRLWDWFATLIGLTPDGQTSSIEQRVNEFVELSREMSQLDDGLYQLDKACAKLMQKTHRHSLDLDPLGTVRQHHHDILQCEHVFDCRIANLVRRSAGSKAEQLRSHATSSDEQLQWAMVQTVHCGQAIVETRKGLNHRELQMKLVGGRLLSAEFQLDLAVWANSIMKTMKSFRRRYPWSEDPLADFKTLSSLITACAIEPELAVTVPASQGHAAATQHEDTSSAGDCMICTMALVVYSDSSMEESASTLVACQICNQALHLSCAIEWWRMSVTEDQNHICPFCRGNVTDEQYISAIERQTALVVEEGNVDED
jgi:hypothetical protein